MKLYTEEQIRKAIFEALYALDAKRIMKYIDEHATPIELPSDEEIEEEFDTNDEKYYIFSEGAKWMRDKIKKQIM